MCAWLGREPLRDLYPSSFSHCVNKDAMVVDMGSWQQHVWKWDWLWTKGLPHIEARNTTGLKNFANGCRAVRERRGQMVLAARHS